MALSRSDLSNQTDKKGMTMQNRFKFTHGESVLRLTDANTMAVYQIAIEGVIQIFDREVEPVEVEPVKSGDYEFSHSFGQKESDVIITDVEKKRFVVHVDGLIKRTPYSDSPSVFAISFDTMPEASDFAGMVFAARKRAIAAQQMSEINGKALLFTLTIVALSFLLSGSVLLFGKIHNAIGL